MLAGGDAKKDASTAAWRRLSSSFSVSAAWGRVGNPIRTTSCMGLVFKVVLTGLAQGVAPPRVPARRREDREVRRPGLARHRALAPQFREQAPRTAVTAVSWASLSGAAGPAASLHRSAPAACVPPFSRARRFRPTLARSGKQKFPRGQLERSEQARKARRGFHLRRPRENYLSIPTLDGRTSEESFSPTIDGVGLGRMGTQSCPQ